MTTTPTKVTLMNFADAAHVVMDYRNRPQQVEIGGLREVELTPTQLRRVQRRHETLMIVPPDIAEKANGPHMRRVLDTLRNFDSLTYDDALNAANAVFGPNELGVRPKKSIIRMALAKRAREAAHYIQAGALDTADKLLGKDRPIAEVKPAKDGPGVVTADIVQGDPDPDAEDTTELDTDETQPETDEAEQGESESEDAGDESDEAGEGDQPEDAAQLSRAGKGPGVALAERDARPAGRTTPRVRRQERKQKPSGGSRRGTR